MNELMQRFIIWEASSRDTIDFKRCYCEISEDLVSGILLSQIIFWFLPNRKNQLKLSIQKEGRYWLAKKRHEWKEECFITENQFDRACKILVSKGFILRRNFKFNGTPTPHISLLVEGLTKALAELHKEKMGELNQNVGLSILIDGELPKPKQEDVKDYFISLSGIKLELYKEAKDYLVKNNKTLPVDKITNDKRLKEFIFEYFWNIYGKKNLKKDSKRSFNKLTFSEIKQAILYTPKYREYAVQYQFKVPKFLDNKVFEDPVEDYDYRKKEVEKQDITKGPGYDDYFEDYKE